MFNLQQTTFKLPSDFSFCVPWKSILTLFLATLGLSNFNWAPSSEFVSSSIPSWQILTAHAQPFRGARDLAFCLKVPLDSLHVWASSEGSGQTAWMRRLAWTFAARMGDKYQIRLTRSNWECAKVMLWKLEIVVPSFTMTKTWNNVEKHGNAGKQKIF